MRIRTLIDIMAYDNGAVAQLGERLPCTEEVRSSSLLSSTCKDMIKVSTKVKEHPMKKS